jgi:hypothetical protein
VEALNLTGGWENYNLPLGTMPQEVHTQEWSGSFSSRIYRGALYAMGDWMREAAWLTNEDGYYLTEGQLCLHFGNYMREHFCRGTGQRPNLEGIMEDSFEMESYWCGAKCCALPGDTIYWKSEDHHRVVSRWEPATDEELRERGWLEQGGLLCYSCQQHRENLTQLDDNENGGE